LCCCAIASGWTFDMVDLHSSMKCLKKLTGRYTGIV
jgi:hypothetical protein